MGGFFILSETSPRFDYFCVRQFGLILTPKLSLSIYCHPLRQDETPRNNKERKLDKMRPKKELHEFTYAEIVKSDTVRIVS